MTIQLPELDGLISRIETLEATVTTLQRAGKGPVKEWYSVQDAAEYLAVSSKTVRRLLDRGLLKRSMGTRHIRISRQELEAYKETTSL